MADGPKVISRDDLKMKIRDDETLTLIEVLAEESFREAHLPGAVNLPATRIRDGIEKVAPDRSSTLVVYCASPACTASDKAAEILTDMGYTEVYDYRGGKEHWKEGGLPLVSQESATADA